MQTYNTRHLTARDHRLVDALQADPRYRRLADILRPPAPTPTPAKAAPQASPEPVTKPVPKGKSEAD